MSALHAAPCYCLITFPGFTDSAGGACVHARERKEVHGVWGALYVCCTCSAVGFTKVRFETPLSEERSASIQYLDA